MNRRKLFDQSFRIACGLCLGLAAMVTLGLILTLLGKGLPAFSLKFLTFDPEHGIGYHCVGTLILIFTALVFAVPIATSLALLHGVYVPPGRMQQSMRIFLFTINGVPSILFGIFGYWLFVLEFGWGRSWLAGGIILGMMIIPSVALALSERIQCIPRSYIEAATSLGLRRSQVIWAVILPQSLSGLITGGLLGLVRAAGEVAPIMFTAVIASGATLPKGFRDSPVLALPYHIFNLAQDTFNDAARAELWAAAVILLGIVATLSLIALPARMHIHEEARHA